MSLGEYITKVNDIHRIAAYKENVHILYIADMA